MNEREAVDALRRMVEVNSFTRNGAGVRRVADLCEGMFRPLGFSARRVPSATPECGDHLLLDREGAGGPGILCVAHLDTVFPPGTAMPWREEGDRIYGPGVADIKGGIVVLWMALFAMREREEERFGRLSFRILLNATEEGGCEDFPRLARAEVRAKDRACLVYETGFDAPGGGSTLVTARKGAARFRYDIRGRATHSGNDHAAGASAVREMARLIEAIEGMSDPARDLTLNVGLAGGGTTVNTVPGSAFLRADLRSFSPADFGEGKRRLLALAGEGSVRSHDGSARCRIDVQEEPGYPPWPENDGSRALAGRLVACGAALGQRLLPTHRKGASDGCHLCDLLPTVDGLGPVGRDTHRPTENITRSSLRERALLSLALFREIADA